MHFSLSNLACIAAIATVASAAPAPVKRDLKVNDCEGRNTAARKQLFRDNGASVEDIAITIQETSCYMSANGVPDYPLYDGKPGEGANFGPFKNNWYAIKLYCSDLPVFDGKDMSNFESGKVLNEEGNLAAAIQCQHQQKAGLDASGRRNGFYAAQRNGETVGGCAGDAYGDTYKAGVMSIVEYLNAGHLGDNTVVNPMVQAC